MGAQPSGASQTASSRPKGGAGPPGQTLLSAKKVAQVFNLCVPDA